MPRSMHQPHGRGRIGQSEQFEQLVGDALARQGHQVVGASGAGVERRASGSPWPKRAWKRKKRRMRRWSSAMRWSGSPMKRHGARRGRRPAEIVEQLAAERVGVERVDGEVAPRGVGRPVVGEGDGGAAAVGRDVAAQGGHFDHGARRDGGDVPCSIPVGTALIPAASSRRTTSSGEGWWRGRDPRADRRAASRTAPPTKRALPPSASSAFSRRLMPGRSSQAEGRASSDAPRQVDEHRRGRAPDVAALPVDLIIMPRRPANSAVICRWLAGSSTKSSGASNQSATSAGLGTSARSGGINADDRGDADSR